MLYIGKTVDDDSRFELDSGDLLTHGLCVGMTGSGKTGLCIDLIEELRLSGTPSIIIDPKGDMTNLLLTFPDLAPSDFAPWIDASADLDREQTAEKIAAGWREGLAKDGIASDRIRQMMNNCPASIYTPGSTAGEPLNILSCLEKPDTDDLELRAQLNKTAVNALLELIGVRSDPLTGREFILLSNILDYCWERGEIASLDRIIAYIQTPPIKRVGVFALDKFFDQDARLKFALKLNGLLASPAFETWRSGRALDIGKLIRSDDGKPSCSVIYLAHLNDAEKTFVIALLTSRILSWSRKQTGTNDLRLLVYVDEAAGLLPPYPANPPAKDSFLALFKQARAFGVGMFVATQNPMDIDYKAMSNAGVWMVGKLSTQNDRRRIVEGMRGVKGVPENLSALLAGLKKRQFLIRNVHARNATVIRSRFAMSYLRGPMTKNDLRVFKKAENQPAELSAINSVENDALVMPPQVKGVAQYYLDLKALDDPQLSLMFGGSHSPGVTIYKPALYILCHVRFDDTRAKVLYDETIGTVVFPLTDENALGHFDSDIDPLLDLRPFLMNNPGSGIRFDPLPPFLDEAVEFEKAGRSFVDYLYRSRTLPLYINKELKLYSKVGQTREAFEQVCLATVDEKAKEKLEKEQSRFIAKIERLDTKRRKIEQRLLDASEDSRARDSESMVNMLESAAGFIFGRRKSIGRAVSSSMTKRRLANKAKRRTDGYRDDLEELEVQIDELQEQMEKAEEEIYDRLELVAGRIEDYPVPAERSDIRPVLTAIIWVPVV